MPKVADTQRHWLYNYAPYKVTYTLKGIKPGSVVYCMEGADWKKTREVKDFDRPQTVAFEPGEMKLYLVAPRRPGGLHAGRGDRQQCSCGAVQLREVKTAWPLRLTVTAPDGKELYRVYRAADAQGTYRESLPLGSNAPAGVYRVTVDSPAGGLSQQAKVEWKPAAARCPGSPATSASLTAVIRKFLAGKPQVIVAFGKGGQAALARNLAQNLRIRGVKATVKPESEVLRKVSYPRVWNPYARLYTATGPTKKPMQEPKLHIKAGVDGSGKFTAITADGKDVSSDWRQPLALVTISGAGYVDYGGDQELCFEPGVMLFFDARRQMQVLRGEMKEVKTTTEFRAKWAKPWERLTTHVGGYQLPPELPEGYTTDSHLILLGDSKSGPAVAALQASELLPQVADARYPGKGRALVSFAWSPFAVEKNVILVGAADEGGLSAGIARLLELAPRMSGGK